MKILIISLYLKKVNPGLKTYFLIKMNPVKLMGFSFSENLIIRAYYFCARALIDADKWWKI